MSDLRYRTPGELRDIIARGEAWQAAEFRKANALEAQASSMEAEAQRIRHQVAQKRRSAHNSGQRITWARIYLAQKEIPK